MQPANCPSRARRRRRRVRCRCSSQKRARNRWRKTRRPPRRTRSRLYLVPHERRRTKEVRSMRCSEKACPFPVVEKGLCANHLRDASQDVEYRNIFVDDRPIVMDGRSMRQRRPITRRRLLARIRLAARKIGRTPKRKELMFFGVWQNSLTWSFGSYREAIRSAGLEPRRPGQPRKFENLKKICA